MMSKFILAVLLMLCCRIATAQNATKITGPLGVYHIAAGATYIDSLGIDSINMQDQFKIGELDFPCQAIDNGFDFRAEIDSCAAWHANRILAIIQPVTEQGMISQPLDTALYAPYAIGDHPGMIQAAQRFSRLSLLYGGYSGAIIDDWNEDTPMTHQIHDAILGKYVDPSGAGTVYSTDIATTPRNKLYGVIYSTNQVPPDMPFIEGVYFAYDRRQNCCYTELDSDINLLVSHFSHKEINIIIYLRNSHFGWAEPVSVQYMLSHAIERYDDGDINGINLFAEPFLNKDYMSLGLWDSLALPHWLDSLYYPYLGQGQGRIYDCQTGEVLQGASVRAYTRSRTTGDSLQRSYQQTDASGQYEFGLWAGNRSTDSTYYFLIAESPGYVTDTIGFWIGRNATTAIPDLSLCPGITGSTEDMLIFPNPSTGLSVLALSATLMSGSDVRITNMLGQNILTYPLAADSQIDLSDQPDGIYLVSVRASNKNISRRLLLLRQ